MAETLSGILDLPSLAQGLPLVEAELVAAVAAENPFVAEVGAHLQRAAGKRIRPALVLLSASYGNDSDHQVTKAAAAVELIHLGSLYHDDVIDQADRRRGVPSVNSRWGNLTAVLGGDLLLGRASEIGSCLGVEASQLLARTLSALVEGEMLEVSRAYKLESDMEGYWRVVELKTASLISTACRLGAMVSRAPQMFMEALTVYGQEIGIAFQLTDDVLDLVADPINLGKPVGTDLGAGVYTLPVLLGLASPVGSQIREILADRPGPEAAPLVRELLESVHAIDNSLSAARSHLHEAETALDGLPPGPVTSTLLDLGDCLVARAAPTS
jgi:geranylgeranyl pyrophosphate synthase